MKCFSDLAKYGANEVLQREYGPYVVEPEAGYDFSILLDLENLPETQGAFSHLTRFTGYGLLLHVANRGKGRIDSKSRSSPP